MYMDKYRWLSVPANANGQWPSTPLVSLTELEYQDTCEKKSAYLISKLPDSVSVVVFWGKNSFHGEIKSQASSLVSDSSLFGIARSCLF